MYRLTCPGDLDTQSIEKTKQQLFVRIKVYTTPTNSTVFSHIEYCTYGQNCESIYNCFEVIKFRKTQCNLLSVEALLF